jgi:hypothetical protein
MTISTIIDSGVEERQHSLSMGCDMMTQGI